MKSQRSIEEIIGIVRARISDAAHLVQDAAPKDLKREWGEKKGAVFCVADGRTGNLYFKPVVLGEIPAEKEQKYRRLCQEKIQRLASRPDHLSSWQSRDPGKEQFGGAIRIGDYIFSMSGLPEAGDEAVLLIAAEMWFGKPAMFDRAIRIVRISQNRYWAHLRTFVDPGASPSRNYQSTTISQ